MGKDKLSSLEELFKKIKQKRHLNGMQPFQILNGLTGRDSISHGQFQKKIHDKSS
jgi:hypothetical protein